MTTCADTRSVATSTKLGCAAAGRLPQNTRSIHGPPNSPSGRLMPCTTMSSGSMPPGRASQCGDNQTYNLNQAVSTSFSCADATGAPGIASCTDSNAAASPGTLNTSAAGTFAYTVTAVSSDGQSATATIHYTVVYVAPSYSRSEEHTSEL